MSGIKPSLPVWTLLVVAGPPGMSSLLTPRSSVARVKVERDSFTVSQ